jgi:hypothetical protein
MQTIAYFFLLALATASTGMAQGIVFQWQLKPGTRLHSEVVQEMERSLVGATQPVKQKTEITQQWEIRELHGDRSASVVTILQRAKLSMDIQGAGVVELDTDKDAAEDLGFAKQIGEMFRPMIGVECNNKMTPAGRISEVTFPDAALKGFRSLPLGGSMEQMLKDSIEKGSPVFPTEPIAPGYKWSQRTETQSKAGILETTSNYRYVGPTKVEGKTLHQFDLNTTLAFKGPNEFNARFSVPQQDIRGKLLFDNELGILVSSELNQSMVIRTEEVNKKPIEEQILQRMQVTFRPAETSKKQ